MENLIREAASVAIEKKISELSSIGSVGSALMTSQGNIYKGCCLDCSCGIGFCAEVNAIGSMITNGESEIKAIVAVRTDGVPLPPCGKCRELMYQLSAKNLNADVVLKDGIVKLRTLLPEPWKGE
jgi:cytidine deaminase